MTNENNRNAFAGMNIQILFKNSIDALALIEQMEKEENNPCDACPTWDMPEACRYCDK